MSLLLQVSRTRSGAAQILEAGLLQAISDSGLFVIDTDVGFGRANPLPPGISAHPNVFPDYDDPTAVRRYHELIASVLRLLVATLVTHGRQNEQSFSQIRQFLTDHRVNVVGMFKRHASIGGKSSRGMEKDLDSIVKSYSVLMMMTRFLEVSSYFPKWSYFELTCLLRSSKKAKRLVEKLRKPLPRPHFKISLRSI